MSQPPLTIGDSAFYEQRARSGANWLYWIAGVTLVVSVVNCFGGSVLGFIGLALPSTAGPAVKSGDLPMAAAVVVIVVCTAVFLGLGVAGMRGWRWPFVVGIVLYAVDTVLYICFKEWFAVAFHVYALYCLAQGLIASNMLAKVRVSERAAAAEQPTGPWYATAQSPVQQFPPPQPVVAEAASAEPEGLAPAE